MYVPLERSEQPIRTHLRHIGRDGCGGVTVKPLSVARLIATFPQIYDVIKCQHCNESVKTGPDGHWVCAETDTLICT